MPSSRHTWTERSHVLEQFIRYLYKALLLFPAAALQASMKIILPLFLTASLGASSAYGWGADGHETVG